MRYEYRIVPAPEKGEKLKGASPEARFAHAMERVLNDMGARGWEYQRCDTLPATERTGLTGTEVQWRNLLVFRRPLAEDAQPFAPRLLEAPEAPRPGDPPRPLRQPEGPTDAADLALRAAMTGRADEADTPS